MEYLGIKLTKKSTKTQTSRQKANMGRESRTLFGYTLIFYLLVHPVHSKSSTAGFSPAIITSSAHTTQSVGTTITTTVLISPTSTNTSSTASEIVTSSTTVATSTTAPTKISRILTNPFEPTATTASTSSTTSKVGDSSSTESTTITTSATLSTISGELSSSSTGHQKESKDKLKLILPLAICIPVGVLAIFAIIVICCCYRRRRSNQMGKSSAIELEEGKDKHNSGFTPQGFLNSAVLPERNVKKSELLRYVEEKQEDVNKYKTEFSMLPGSGIKPWKIGKAEPDRNRYINIIPYDENRVCLKGGSTKSGYINASFIDGYKEPKAYIAAQGPMDNTVNDFWQMIWEQNCSRIIMVTNILEGDKVKCSKYWPDLEDYKEMQFGEISVKILKEKPYNEFIIRTFNIHRGEEKRDLYQFHFTHWPDQDAPDTCTSMLKFYQLSFLPNDSYPITGPLLVHCSAGVGRTGTLIALDILLQQMKEKEAIDIPKCIEKLRQQRVNMVQSTAQYILLHQALLEYVLLGDVEIRKKDFQRHYSQLVRSEEKSAGRPLQQQYNVLKALKPKFYPYQFSLSQADINQSKNRNNDILPMDNFIPNFSIPGEGLDCYINAVYVKGYLSGPHIATQMPMSNTMTEFWNLVYEDRAAAIVMLNNIGSDSKQYWPDDGKTLKAGDLEITTTGEIPTDNIQVIDLRITRNRKSPRHSPKTTTKSSNTVSTMLSNSTSSSTLVPPTTLDRDTPRKVRIIRVLDWPEAGSHPKDRHTLLDVYQELQRCRRMNSDGRIIVHCLYGAERTGVFCSLLNTLDKLNSDKIVDVFNSVKRARRTRPEFIVNKEQYAYLYELVSVYLKSLESGDTNREQSYANMDERL